MRAWQVGLSFIALTACETSSHIPPFPDAADVGDGSLGSNVDSKVAEASDAALDGTVQGRDADLPGSDGGDGSAAEATPDASSPAPDGSAPGAPSPSCLTTRTAPDPTVLFLPGKVFSATTSEYSSKGIAEFSETVLGYNTGGDASQARAPVGWSLWRKDTGQMIDDSEFTADPSRATEVVLAVSGERFLTRERRGGPHDIVLHDAHDGHELWRATGWSPLGPKMGPTTAGISSDGSYVWVEAPLFANDGSTLFEVFNTDSATPFISLTLDFALQAAWASPTELVVLTGDSTGTTLRRFDRAGAELTPIGPLPGGFTAAFTDESHFITKAFGDIVRIYSRTGELKHQTTRAISDAGGVGDLFWWWADNATEVYRLSAPNVLVTSHASRAVVTDGAQAIKAAGSEVLVVGPDAATVASLAPNAELAVSKGGHLLQLTSEGILGASLPRALGCGYITGMVADATRLYISTTASGTLVYEAPFQAPVRQLPSGLVITTRSSTRIGLRTSASEVTIYDRDLQPVTTLSVDPVSDVSLSFDGTKLGTSAKLTETGRDIRSRVVDVATGQVLHSIDESVPNSAGNGAIIAHAPRFSPSGARFATSALGYGGSNLGVKHPPTTIFEGSTTLGVIPGQSSDWIDDTQVVAYLVEGASIVNTQGIRTAAFACDFFYARNRQWLTPTRYFDGGSLATCDLVANARTPDMEAEPAELTWLMEDTLARFETVYAYARRMNEGVRIR